MTLDSYGDLDYAGCVPMAWTTPVVDVPARRTHVIYRWPVRLTPQDMRVFMVCLDLNDHGVLAYAWAV